MEPSEEIRRIVHRWTKAIAEGDAESALARLSEHPGTLVIGTDPAELWRGQETRAVWGRQIEELGAFPVTADEIEAWEEGTVGWASVMETVALEGKSFDARATYVFHLERGEWKVVQVHWSVPQPNEEVLGRALTVTLEELERGPARPTRPLAYARRGRHRDDRLHRHRGFDRLARPAR